MESLLKQIHTLEASEMDALLTAVRHRFSALFPTQEIHILIIRKDECLDRQVDDVIALLQRMKSSGKP